MKIFVSACLLGENCKYDGGNNYSEAVKKYIEGHEVISMCPEVEGGLPIPRIPAEIVNGVVTNRDGVSQSGVISCSVTDEYAAMSLSELPRGEKDLQEWQQEVIPDGYVMIRGVHLRKERSSHSADLGLFNAGAIVQFLGKEDGNPYYWAHVRIGDLEGYMAGNYICFDELGEKGYYFDALLPVVKARGSTSLKRGRGLFDGTVADIEAGTKMHVLAEYDDWYYVVVPQETIQARMDIYGTYGYISKDQVESSTIFDLE